MGIHHFYEHNNVYVHFIDYIKAFDKIRHERHFELSGNRDLQRNDIQII